MSLEKSKKVSLYWSIFLLSALFYLAFFFHDGVILTEDANSYITMETNREPVYCSFLWILRSLFLEESYLKVAAILQCLIAAFAATAITTSFKNRFQLSGTEKCVPRKSARCVQHQRRKTRHGSNRPYFGL